MPAWKKVITSGSDASLNKLVVDTHISASLFSGSFYGDGSSITNLNASNLSSGTIPDARFPSALPAIDGSALTGISAGGGIFVATGSFQSTTNDLQITGSLQIYKSGSTVFNIEGSQGTLFTVTDELSGSLFSVNDISGIPILEVFSDDTVKIGTYNAEAIIVSGSSAIITGSFTGSFVGDGVGLTNISGSSLYDNIRTYRFEMGVSSTAEISTGAKGLKTVPYLGTIIGWKLVSDTATSTVVDLWKRNNAIPTITDSITAGAKPALTSAQLATSTTLTGWTTSVSPDDVFLLYVDSNTVATYISLELDILLT